MSPSPPVIRRALPLLTTKGRRRQSCFLVEGLRAVTDVLESTGAAREVIATPGISADSAWGKLASQQKVPIQRVDEAEFSRISQVVNGQGLAAIAHCPEPISPDLGLMSQGNWCAVVADGVSDPGNIGTLMRTAEAAGAGSVFLTPGSIDPYNPKVVRSALGSLLRCPPRFMDAGAIVEKARVEGVRIAILDGQGKTSLSDFAPSAPTVFVVGGEAHGPGRDLQHAADDSIRIELDGDVESLNAAVAAAAVLFSIRDRLPRPR